MFDLAADLHFEMSQIIVLSEVKGNRVVQQYALLSALSQSVSLSFHCCRATHHPSSARSLQQSC